MYYFSEVEIMTILSELTLSHLSQIQNIIDEKVQNFGAGRLNSATIFILADDAVKFNSNLPVIWSL